MIRRDAIYEGSRAGNQESSTACSYDGRGNRQRGSLASLLHLLLFFVLLSLSLSLQGRWTSRSRARIYVYTYIFFYTGVKIENTGRRLEDRPPRYITSDCLLCWPFCGGRESGEIFVSTRIAMYYLAVEERVLISSERTLRVVCIDNACVFQRGMLGMLISIAVCERALRVSK